MKANSSNFDFNSAGEQRSFDVIPAGTVCTLQLTIRPGGAGDDGWLKRAADGASEGLGTRPGHEDAGKFSRNTFRAMLESARGIRPDDKSEGANAARRTSGWQDFDGLRFVARLGARPPKGIYPAKNTISEVITPERQEWKKPEQNERDLLGTPTNSGTAPAPAPANAIARPQWAG
jgi:hypothetical protein